MQAATTPDDRNAVLNRKKSSFIWGIVLATIPSTAFIAGTFNMFKGISSEKATGLGGVAGGMAEAFCLLGALCAFFVPTLAIVNLAKSFAPGRTLRNFLSALSIAWCSLILLLYSLGIWTTFVLIPRMTHQ